MSGLLKKRSLLLVLVGVVLLAGAGAVWCYQRCTSAERVFWGMLEQSLTTSAVTVQVKQENEGSGAAQTAQYSFGAQNMSRSVTTLTQPGTVIRNEAIGTPTADFTRYLSISTDRKTASGKPLDFSKVMGVWAKGEVTDGGELLPQSMLGTGLPLGGLVVPIGNLSAEHREKLLKQIKDDNLYRVAFDKTQKSKQNGRSVYKYDVTMSAVAYASMMKAFAKSVGFHQLDELDPQNFSGQGDIKVKITVDIHARQLVRVSTEDESIAQDYMSYNVPIAVSIPKDTVSVTELQKRLTELQQ